MPWDEALRRVLGQLALTIAVGIMTRFSCARSPASWRAFDGSASPRRDWSRLAMLPLVPATVAVGFGILATFDPGVPCQSIYRRPWLIAALASVPIQWAWLWLDRSSPRRAPGTGDPLASFRGGAWPAATIGLVVSMTVVGFWLRIRETPTEPLHNDELTVVRSALGLFERGFPSLKISDDLPIYYISGCELEGLGVALASLVFSDDCYVSRFPTVFWSTLTIPLLFWVTRRFFGDPAGLIAAGLYTFAATPIQMANFGRYPCQLQFFTILTTYLFWKTIRGTGAVDRRTLTATTLSFLAMFFSWEASALIAPGMVLAMLVERRGRIWAILADPAVWMAVFLVLAAILAQFGHGFIQQAKFLVVGTGWGDVKMTAMWNFPVFNLLRPVGEAGWSQDALAAVARARLGPARGDPPPVPVAGEVPAPDPAPQLLRAGLPAVPVRGKV